MKFSVGNTINHMKRHSIRNICIRELFKQYNTPTNTSVDTPKVILEHDNSEDGDSDSDFDKEPIVNFDKGKGKDIGCYTGKLPDEIIIQIVSHLPTETPQDLRFLKQLSLISPTFRTASQSLLFRHITTRPFASLLAQVAFLSSGSHIALRIRVLSICPRSIIPTVATDDGVYEWQQNRDVRTWTLRQQGAVLYKLVHACRDVLEEVRLLYCGEDNYGYNSTFAQQALLRAVWGVLGRVKLRRLKKVVLFKGDMEVLDKMVDYEEREWMWSFSAIEGQLTVEDEEYVDYGSNKMEVKEKVKLREVYFKKDILRDNLSRVVDVDCVSWYRPPRELSYAKKMYMRYEVVSRRDLLQARPNGSFRPGYAHLNITPESTVRTPLLIFSRSPLALTSLQIFNSSFEQELSEFFSDPALVTHLRSLELKRLKLDCGNTRVFDQATKGCLWQDVFKNILGYAGRLMEFKVDLLTYQWLTRFEPLAALSTWEGEGWDDDVTSLRALWGKVQERRLKEGIEDLEELGELVRVKQPRS